MKQMRKLLSLLLAAVFCLTLAPVTAAAGEGETAPEESPGAGDAPSSALPEGTDEIWTEITLPSDHRFRTLVVELNYDDARLELTDVRVGDALPDGTMCINALKSASELDGVSYAYGWNPGTGRIGFVGAAELSAVGTLFRVCFRPVDGAEAEEVGVKATLYDYDSGGYVKTPLDLGSLTVAQEPVPDGSPVTSAYLLRHGDPAAAAENLRRAVGPG